MQMQCMNLLCFFLQKPSNPKNYTEFWDYNPKT